MEVVKDFKVSIGYYQKGRQFDLYKIPQFIFGV
jgi:hypothetical protein